MDDRETWQRTLIMAQSVLALLEEQAAGYTILTIPTHLKIQLEEKRKEVASLKARLSQLEGRRPATLPDNLPRRPEIFVGREEEVRRCLGALSPDERGWGVTIDGIGGIGKTALTLEVAHQAKERAGFDAYLFASAKTSRLTADGVQERRIRIEVGGETDRGNGHDGSDDQADQRERAPRGRCSPFLRCLVRNRPERGREPSSIEIPCNPCAE